MASISSVLGSFFGSIAGSNQDQMATTSNTTTLGNTIANSDANITIGGTGVLSFSGDTHLGSVKYFRKKFKEYSKEEFREMSEKPVIKEILAGLAKVPKEDVAERIRLYLED